ESEREIEKIAAIAGPKGATARVCLRVNPDIDARSHPYISTGLRQNKFGVDIARAEELFARARRLSGVRMVGLQAHIGSQIFDLDSLAQTARELSALAGRVTGAGFAIETLDVGGGLGVGPNAPSPEAYAAAVLPALEAFPGKILIEPGRATAAPAGVLLTSVLYVKQERGRTFVVVDAGMNDLMRPALYQACHTIEPVRQSAGGETITADVVGPVCETADSFL